MAERRFAEDTRVMVDTSRLQIEAMLKRAKATRIVHMDDPLEAVVAFMLADRAIRIEVPIAGGASAQDRRARWRALHMIIKAKLEAVAQNVTTVEQEFLAHVVMPSGQTVDEWLKPQLEIAFNHGEMPKLLSHVR